MDEKIEVDEKGEVFNKRITYESAMVEKKRVKYKSKGRSMSAMVEKREVQK